MDARAGREINPTDRHVGARVRMRRLMLGMTQTMLGDAVGVTFQQVQKYEKGVNRVSASRMQQFAKLLDVPVSFFFEGAPPPKTVGGKIRSHDVVMSNDVQEFLSIRDGLNLIKAFSRIADRKVRRSVVDLVEQIANQLQRG